MDLPPNTAHKLDQTLAQWQHWRGPDRPPGAPHVVQQLSGGISNYNILVEAAGRRYVVRLDRANPASNGLNRQAEWRALHAAHTAGIAPCPRYFNPELGVLVCDYLPPDTVQQWSTQALARLLRAIHTLPRVHFRMDPAERMRRYERQLPAEKNHIVALGETIRSRDVPGTNTSTLCHHDLNPSNLLLSGGRLHALDWEYCAMGSPWFDLAVVMDESPMGEPERELLLESYLDRPPQSEERQALEHQGLIARYLALLWFATGQGDQPDDGELARRERELRERMGLNP